MKADLNIWGPPNAAAQAIALLDAFGNDLQAAFHQAEHNMHYAPRDSDTEFESWISVAEILQMPEMNPEKWN